LKTTQTCLVGTRMEILQEIVDWIHDQDANAPRICWLHGQAGRGKSAVAHTIALHFKNIGKLGSCFCFANEKITQDLESKMFSTIARDLADCNLTFRRELARAIAEDSMLRSTADVVLQWEKLLVEPLSKVSGGIWGNVVLVIDALDETTAYLPSNFRILLTSRPLPDIMLALRDAQDVKEISLDYVPAASIERDIHLYVSKEVERFGGIDERKIEHITWMANGLFVWARLACEFIKRGAGGTVMERFDDLTRSSGMSLLDRMYRPLLESIVGRSPMALPRFRSLMRQIIYTEEPLPMDALHAMRMCFRHQHDCYPVAVILNYMGSLLGGITDHSKPIRPLHVSFYDFLTDQSRSGDYFVDESDIQTDLAVASLHVLRDGLHFNICGLESSYLVNSEVPDLTERINARIPHHLSYSCRFWAKHLQATKFDHVLAGHVRCILQNEKILFWFEALSLLGVLGDAAVALSYTVRWLQVSRLDATALAKDGMKMIHNFSSAASASTPHLYISALPFTPENTVLYRALNTKFSCIAKVAGGNSKGWPLAQVVFQGHSRHVNAVAFSLDGTRVVSGSSDKTVRIWDAEKGLQIGSPLEGHSSFVRSVAFSSDGKRIVSGSDDKTVRVWDANRGVQIGLLQGHTSYVTSVAFSPNGTRIVSGSWDKTVRVWDIDMGVQVGNPLQGHTDWVTSVAVSPDGTRIVSSSNDETIRVWDAEMGVQVGSPLQGHTDWVTSIAFSPDGARIVSGSSDETVRVWDADKCVQIDNSLQGHTHCVTSVAFSPDGIRIVSGSSDKTVRVWDTDIGVQIGSPYQNHTSSVKSVAFSPDGTRIVSGSNDQTIRVWDADTSVPQIDSLFDGHISSVISVASSPCGTRIVSGSSDKAVRLWDAKKGMQIGSPLQGHTDCIRSVAFSFDGKRIVSGSDDKTVRVWNTENGLQIVSPLHGHTDRVTSVAFSHNGTKIVSGSHDKTVRVWDADRGVQIGSPLQGHTDWVTSVVFSPNDTRIVSGSLDKTVRVWHADRVKIGGSLQGHTDGVTSVAFSPDGTRIVSGSSDQTVRIWDVDMGVQIGSPFHGHISFVTSVAFSADGTRIASGSNDMTVRVWDAARGVQIGSPLHGHTSCVTTVAFSSDSTSIVSGSNDETMRIW
ncbi:hypothetical protein SCLCIDRAFT_97925, partial [Scleroderma citrinum Foug A]